MTMHAAIAPENVAPWGARGCSQLPWEISDEKRAEIAEQVRAEEIAKVKAETAMKAKLRSFSKFAKASNDMPFAAKSDQQLDLWTIEKGARWLNEESGVGYCAHDAIEFVERGPLRINDFAHSIADSLIFSTFPIAEPLETKTKQEHCHRSRTIREVKVGLWPGELVRGLLCLAARMAHETQEAQYMNREKFPDAPGHGEVMRPYLQKMRALLNEYRETCL